MKITVYTIKDCAFSKQEKEYLNTNKLAFEEKDLETNKDFLTEMLAISNNFAGTPVTRIEKDDGSIAVLKGFTKEEFDITFGFAAPQPVPEVTKPVETPPVAETTVAPEAVPPTETVSPAPVETPFDSTSAPLSASAQGKPVTETADPLKSVMDDLQSKSQPVEEIAPPPVVENSPPTNPPSEQPTAEPAVPNVPTIPDFPAK